VVFRERRSQRDVEGSASRRMWRTPRKKEVIEIHPANGLLLAHYKKGHSRICKEMP